MGLMLCSGCRRHVRDGEGCPFCGGRPRTALHVWKAAVLTAVVPLGLVACSSGPVAEDPGEAKPPATETKPATPDPVMPDPKPTDVDSADPDPSGQEPVAPEPADPEPVEPEPVEPEPAGSAGGDNSKPDGTDTPIVKERRPAKKYGAPPRPRTKYGGPPKPRPTKPTRGD